MIIVTKMRMIHLDEICNQETTDDVGMVPIGDKMVSDDQIIPKWNEVVILTDEVWQD